MPQLDGLRALAVGSVLLQHELDLPWVRRVGPGALGVWLFFVLSGFLITRILLACRDDIAAGAQSLRGALKAFYARRFLRIAPVYYVVLLGAAALDVPPVRRTFAWHAAYLSNVYFARRGAWDGPVTPFWSLAVEEQFYLVWPLVVLGVPRRFLLAAIVAPLAFGPLLRLFFLRVLHTGTFSLGLLPFGCTDQLVWGALLALCWRAPSAMDPLRRRVRAAGLWAGLPFVVAFRAFGPFSPGSALETLGSALHLTAAATLFFAVVDSAARGETGPFAALLTARPMRAIGRISYGIYVQHTFVRTILLGLGALPGCAALGRWLQATAHDTVRWSPFALATVLATASLSWVVLERPINEFKRYFPYKSADRRPAE